MSGSWRISIPAQGVSIETADQDKIIEFLNSEISYYGRLAIDNAPVIFGNQNLGTISLSSKASRELTSIIAEVRDNKVDALNRYISNANERLVLVGESPAGKRVERLKQSSTNAATLGACILSEAWAETSHTAARDLVSIFRSIAFANPSIFAFDNLIDASNANKESARAFELSKNASKKLEDFIGEKTELFQHLENLYRRQLTIQEPAVSWQNISRQKTRIWQLWLSIFAILVALPIALAIVNWSPVAQAIATLTNSSSGGFSFSGLAAISIPALFYAWLLKNVSRIFIQNLNLADDADHRRSLALTYMGLLQDEKRPTSDQDRAIILNALFRPLPTHTNDEGPPAGLIELIKK